MTSGPLVKPLDNPVSILQRFLSGPEDVIEYNETNNLYPKNRILLDDY